MAKYLQDIYIYAPKPASHFSKAEEEAFYENNKYLWKSISLIEDLYNYNFPAKYSTHDNLWRLFIAMTTDPNLDLTEKGYEHWFYLDIEHLKSLDETNRKKFLFEKISLQVIEFCKRSSYSFAEFEKIHETITVKNILFNEQHQKQKFSDDRKHVACMWRKYDEFENATYIKIMDKARNTVLFKKIADLHFKHFDRISWKDNDTVLAYKINQYAGFKQAEDYYQIDISGLVEFKPQTKEETCYYGIELMRDPRTFEKGLEYIKAADKMGHGKAKNILQNLALSPDKIKPDWQTRNYARK